MPIDPSAPENSSRLPHQRLVERSIPGIENASPEQLIRADGVGQQRGHLDPREAWLLLEIFQAPRTWVEKAYPTLSYFDKVDRGGHFAAWEAPEVFASEVRAAFRSLR